MRGSVATEHVDEANPGVGSRGRVGTEKPLGQLLVAEDFDLDIHVLSVRRVKILGEAIHHLI